MAKRKHLTWADALSISTNQTMTDDIINDIMVATKKELKAARGQSFSSGGKRRGR